MMVHLDCLEFPVKWEPEDFLDQEALLAYLVRLEFLVRRGVRVQKEMRDHLDLQDHLARREARGQSDLQLVFVNLVVL